MYSQLSTTFEPKNKQLNEMLRKNNLPSDGYCSLNIHFGGAKLENMTLKSEQILFI